MTVLTGGGGVGTTVTLSASFTGLAPGVSFAVSETVPSGFVPVGPVVCTTSFGPGGSATCAFTDQAKGQIVVTKQVEGGSGSFTFSLTGNGTSTMTVLTGGGGVGTTVTLSASFTGLAPGVSFTVSETVPSGFVPVGPVVCTTSFGPGGSATCAFTDQAKGQIVVTKQVEGGSGSFTFSLTGTGTTTMTVPTGMTRV